MTTQTKTGIRRSVAISAVLALAWPVFTGTTAAQATEIDGLNSETVESITTLPLEDAIDALNDEPEDVSTPDPLVNPIQADKSDVAEASTSADAPKSSVSIAIESDSPAALAPVAPAPRVAPRAGEVNVAKWVTDPTSPVIGSTVRWHLSVEVPVLGPGEEVFTQFSFIDELPASFEYYSTIVISPQTLPVSGGYRYDAATHTITFGADSDLSPEFQNWLISRQGQTIEVSVAGRVIAVGDTHNTLSASINGTTETASASSRWGKLRIEKTDPTGNRLPNAEFQVFTTEDDALAGTNPINFPTRGTTLITDSTGRISVPSLYVGNATQDTRDYWVRETAAPEDFVISGGTVGDEPGIWQVTLDGTTASVITLSVVNQKLNPDPEPIPDPEPTPDPIPQPPPPGEETPETPTSEVLAASDAAPTSSVLASLPVTGSDSRALALTGGAALLLLGLGATFIVTRRRTRGISE